jgi:uncharacterized protein DUF6644
MLFPLFQWLHNTEFATALRESALVFPIILTSHLVGMALFGGLILMVDMRLLGLAMKNRPVADVVNQLRIWKRIGFVFVVSCGICLGWSKAENYYPNPFFWLKMTLLALVGVHALVFRRSVYSQAAEFDRTKQIPGRAKLAAVLSLLLWFSLVSAGRLIGYWEPPQDQRATTSSPK